jgi:SagB-type dehydrogenase family enzyme
MHRGLLEHPLYTTSSVVGLLRADMRRMRFKYGERSYRFALLESGHLVQNVLLLAAAAQLAAVPIGGFLDADVNKMLRADGVTEFCTYAFLLGTP